MALSIIDREGGIENIQPYEQLKETIVQLYTKSKSELMEVALTIGQVQLEGQKPSLVLARIRRKLRECGLIVGDF